ncbi:helix-turn-helix domain-containing protein [Nocardioides sp.]|uniref:winged helix-turn-helix transcriptional regulator n=1 Tax=Nocardioides sp. TaxID=35761 RepID=UPI002ED02438
MEPHDGTDYCSFTKAIEHLGDRWNLLIVRELGVHGPRRFNELAAALPGRISRSVLTERLRRLESLGVVTRADRDTRSAAYRLTVAGEGLMPTLWSLRTWSATWLPDDPSLVERDPEIVFDWLARRVDTRRLPEQQVVVEITNQARRTHRGWLVLERGADPYGCLQDPLLAQERYVYVQAGSTVLLGLATGHRDWASALADGSVVANGAPELTRQLARWFTRPVPDPAVRRQAS